MEEGARVQIQPVPIHFYEFFNRGPAAGGAFDFDHEKLGLNPPVESYRVIHRLTDHTSDVAGLEWSPDGRWLASCGLDSNILIWDVACGFKLTAKLEGHKGFVKGLAWDPLGVYLASQSDDHTMIIWRTRDWQYETMLKKPFDQANEETFFRRPSWSPDGAFVAAANAVNGRQPVISLISRDQWKPEIAFVGHLLAVEVARFSPFLYQRKASNESESVGYLCAAGSQDCNTSLWTDASPKPLAVLTDLFEHAVMDIEWLPDGLSLLVAAYDGTVALVRLSPELVGRPLFGAEEAAHLARIRKGSDQGAAQMLPSSITDIKLQSEFNQLKEQISKEGLVSSEIATAPVVPVAPAAIQPINVPVPVTAVKQVETKTKEGKRRVAPLLVQQETQQRPFSQSSNATTMSQYQPQIPTVTLKVVEPVVLQAPSLQKRLYVELDSSISVEATNNRALGATLAETRIRFTNGGKVVWEEGLESHVVVLLADPLGFVIVALQNKTLILFSASGRRLTPPLILEAGPLAMSCLDGQLLAVLETGQFFLWNLVESRLIRRGTISQLVTKGSALSSIILLPTESFRVAFVDGRVYEYVARMDMFVQTSGGIFKALEYDRTEQSPTECLSVLREAMSVDKHDARMASIAALESRLSLAALQQDTRGFASCLATYIRRMVTEGMKERVFETLTSIARSQSPGFPFISLDRTALLRSLRPLLAGHADADFILAELDLN